MNTFRHHHHAGQVHISDEHGLPQILITLPNGQRITPAQPLPRKWRQLTPLVRQAQRKVRAAAH